MIANGFPVPLEPAGHAECSQNEQLRQQLYVVALAATLVLLCTLFAALAGGVCNVVSVHGDNPSYLGTAEAILRGHLPLTTKHFFGLAYATAAFSAATHLSPPAALYLISVGSFLAATWLVTRLWGMHVGVVFTVCNWTWLEFSAFGGAEPLFVFLLFLAIWLSRSHRYLWAVAIASVSTTVRPLGIFLVCALLIAAFRDRGIKSFLICLAAAAGIALLYVAPLIRAFHDPLANVHAYQQQDWGGGVPIGLPLKAIAMNYLNGRSVGNLFIKHAKVAFVLAHIAALAGVAASSAMRREVAKQPVVSMFVLTYSAFILVYNAPWWALSIYPRLLIPLAPFFLWLYRRWLPRGRTVWSAVAAFTIVLACGAGVGYSRARLLIHPGQAAFRGSATSRDTAAHSIAVHMSRWNDRNK